MFFASTIVKLCLPVYYILAMCQIVGWVRFSLLGWQPVEENDMFEFKTVKKATRKRSSIFSKIYHGNIQKLQEKEAVENNDQLCPEEAWDIELQGR